MTKENLHVEDRKKEKMMSLEKNAILLFTNPTQPLEYNSSGGGGEVSGYDSTLTSNLTSAVIVVLCFVLCFPSSLLPT